MPTPSSVRRKPCRRAGRRDARPHQGGRFQAFPMPDGPFAYLWKFREGGQHEQIGRTARDGGEVQTVLDGDALAKDVGLLQVRRPAAFARPPARGLERRPARIGILHHPGTTLGNGEDLPDVLDASRRQRRLGPRFDVLLLCPGRRQSSAAASSSGIVWARRRADDVLVYEEKDTGWFTHIEESASGRFCIISGGDHDTSEQRLIDLARSGRGTAPDRAAREGRALRRRRPRRRTFHPHQRRRRHRLPHRHRAARLAGARALARADRASAGHLYPRHRTVCRSSGPAGACERPALDRDPRPRRRAPNTPSPSTRPPIRSTCRAATNSTRRHCASPTRR